MAMVHMGFGENRFYFCNGDHGEVAAEEAE
jgi:hypothetical protein